MINSSSKINAITLEYTLKLDLNVCFTNIKAQKINTSIFKIFGINLANFQIKNKLNQAQYFEKTFLLADINIKMLQKMTFLTLNNANI